MDPALFSVLGAAAGWLVYRIVNRFAEQDSKMEQPLTILCSAALMASLWVKFRGPGELLFVYGSLGMVLVGVTLFDIRKQEIPHIVTIPGIVAGLILGTYVLPLGFVESILGLLVGGGVLIVATWIEAVRKKEIGGGDWKYAAMIGSFIGWQKVVVALVLTGVFALFGTIILRISGIPSRPQALGPWLSAGAIASILFG